MRSRCHRLWVGLALLPGLGCSRALPPPRPVELWPATVQQEQSVPVVVHGTDFLPGVVADYADPRGSSVDARFQLFLGEVALEEVVLVSSTRLEARVPAGLPTGLHDLRVVAPHGAEGLLAAAFTVQPLPDRTPTRLGFVTAARTALVGTCSEEVTVALQDESGSPVPSTGPTPLTVSVAPQGALSLFTDPGCSAPLEALAVTAGETRATLFFRGGSPQPATLTVRALELAPVEQVQQLIAPGMRLAWAPLPATVRRGAELEVTLRALDASGTQVTTFAGSAALSVSGGTALLCVVGCGAPAQTLPFQEGEWRGVLRLGAPAGAGRVLTATSGPLQATAPPLEVLDPPALLPRATLVRSPAVVRAGETVFLDGSGSTSPTGGALSYAWDPLGAGGPASPWSGWDALPTLTFRYDLPGRYRARLAVRDAEGSVDHAEVEVRVIEDSTELCRVTRSDGADDGDVDCSATDLSLPEAVRISNARSGAQVITFLEDLQVSAQATLTVSDGVEVIGATGVSLTGLDWVFQGGTVRLSSLRQGPGNGDPLMEVRSGAVTLSRLTIQDHGPVEQYGGSLEVEDVHFEECHGACVEINLGAGDFAISGSFLESPGGNGLSIVDCRGARREVHSSIFTRMNKGVVLRNDCGTGPVVVSNNTFHQLQIGVALEAGAGHVMVNNIFSENDSEPLRGCELSFAQRSHSLIFNSDPDECTHLDPGVLQGDPRFVDPFNDDFRLRSQSPARDSGVTVTPGWAPLSFLGMAPDRGGRESW